MTALVYPEDRGALSLDTVRLRLDPGAVPEWSRRRFQSRETADLRTGEVVEHLRLDGAAHGVNRVDVYEDTGVVVVQVSAKALLGDYGRGITTGTLGRLANAVTGTEAVKVTVDALASATVLRADVVEQVWVGPNRIRPVIDALGVLRSHPKLGVVARPGSIEIRKAGRGVQDRLIAYDKAKELVCPRNRDFLRDAGAGVLASASGVVRFERNAADFKTLRACSGVLSGPVALSDLLGAPRRPVADLLDRWLAKAPLVALFEGTATEGTSWGEYERALGRRVVLEACGHDPAGVRAAVIARCGPKNVARYLGPYLADIARHEAGETPSEREETVRTLTELVTTLRN